MTFRRIEAHALLGKRSATQSKGEIYDEAVFVFVRGLHVFDILELEVTMPDIFHDFPIKVSPGSVFEAISTPQGLDAWWTKKSSGRPAEGEEYKLWFGPQYDWRALVTMCVAPSEFELEILGANPDWNGTRVGFHLRGEQTTVVRFYHTGWPMANEHWRISCYCWAMYLRILRRYLEHGEIVPYETRLDA